MLDVRAFLTKFNVPFAEPGTENVGKNYLGLPVCPSCGKGGNHYGVNIFTGACSCWVCQHKGSVYDFVKHFTGASSKEIYKRFKESKTAFPVYQKEEICGSLKFPHGMVENLPRPHKEYLRNRGFDPDFLELRFGLKAFGMLNKLWQYRIIVPIYMQNKCVSYLGRAIFDHMLPRYKNALTEHSIIPVKQCLYGLDEVGNHAVLVEGLIDRWRFGSGAISTMGVEVTNKQISFLKKQGVNKVTVLFDPDKAGKEAASKISQKISLIGLDSRTVLWHGSETLDVGDRSLTEIEELRKEIFK
jgi:5S rRNA maturation endonuclease (ribonuclease M5)